MLHFILFMLFSTIEGIAVYAMALYVFRFDLRKYIWHCLIIIEIINVQNYLTRVEVESLAFFAPVANLLITILFLTTIVRIPLLWSSVVSGLSYAFYVSVQSVFIVMTFSLEEIRTDPVKGYIVQLVTGLIGIGIGYALYRRGYGFTFDFTNTRMRREKYILVTLIVMFLVMIAVASYLLDIYIGTFGFMAALLIFLIYSIKKEASDA